MRSSEANSICRQLSKGTHSAAGAGCGPECQTRERDILPDFPGQSREHDWADAVSPGKRAVEHSRADRVVGDRVAAARAGEELFRDTRLPGNRMEDHAGQRPEN